MFPHLLSKRDEDCVRYTNGEVVCYDGFWGSDKGVIIKWVILALFFGVFFGWFVGGYIHAKRRLKKGLPLLSYHRFLISYSERKRHGQVPQNHFTFYAQPNPYYQQGQPQHPQYQQGQYAEPPPLYQNDAPPQYFAPPKQNEGQGQGVEMPMYGAPAPQGQYGQGQGMQGGQQSGVVGSGSANNGGQGDVEGQTQQQQQLPPRPQQAKAVLRGFVDRFRK